MAAPVIVIVVSRPDETSQVSFWTRAAFSSHFLPLRAGKKTLGRSKDLAPRLTHHDARAREHRHGPER
jgi:hypothetical protein